MEELLQAPTEGFGETIVIPKILAENFEIKMNLLQLVQDNKFHGHENDNPHTHINNFKRMTATLKYTDVPNDAIKLMIFSYSLEDRARICEAWGRFKELLRACPHHGFSELTQIDTFYNGLIEQDQDPLNVASGGNLLNKTTREALQIIENKSKVHYSRSKSNVSRVNTSSRDVVSKTDDRIDKLADQISNLVDIVNKQVLAPAKAVEKTCVTCEGAHAYYECIATDSNPFSVYAATGSYNQVSSPNRASHQIPPPGFAPVQNNSNRTSPQLRVLFRVILYPTRRVLAYEGPSIPTESPLEKVDEQNTEEILDKEHSNSSGSTAQVQPSVVPILILEPDVLRTQSKPSITYPSSLLANKDKIFELAKVPLNENCSAMLLKKLPEKLGDPGKSLIPCDFPRMEVFHALADLGASINLMPLSIWKKLSLPELTPTRMTIKLADRSITRPKRVTEDVFVKVGKFHFLTDFGVVDFEADPRVPLILGRSFLRTGYALIDVYREEITLRDVLDFQYNPKSSSPTLVSGDSIFDSDSSKMPIVKSSSPTLTPFGESDFFLEEIEDFHNNDLIPTRIENSVYDPEGDILFLENFLNEDTFQLPPMDFKVAEESKEKFSVEEPPELELKELPSHLDPWISPIHYVPKKGGMIMVSNENNELIPTRLVTGWRVCIDYRKLNDATMKDHFPLPFMDQMLKRLAGNEFYCFLDGFSGYFQIPIDPQDKEKTTFTCPYGTFAYRRMPIWLGSENLAADHLSRLENPYQDVLENKDINENFPLETLGSLTSHNTPWFADIVNFHAGNFIKKGLTSQQKKKFFKDLLKFSKLAMGDLQGGHHGANLTAKKGKISQRDEMPQNTIDYLSKWVEAKSLPTNDARVVVKFLKSLFSRVGIPQTIISDRGTHFCNDQFTRVMIKYGVTHRLATAYHPQTSDQVEISNHGLKRILERTLGENRASWSDKLDDALWAFRTAFKTPIGCNPYKLVYGKSSHLPIELEHRAYWALKHVNFNLKTAGDHRMLQLNELSELRD
uniref:Reverse transcriptase domain-containing protein n=1 Tax=Tanacetum cinerariifolium TaxID=118510 RepID=A0A6L2MZC0_TANCI|nr:reverse transcriptase domain-containing protein [Tanacetum cinerariifolium]